MSAQPSVNGAIAPLQVRRLPNGLTLLIRENHDVPVATVDAWVGTGSAGETPEIGGIAHFLEHMMFKGTENFGLGQIEREIENVGGVCNAATSYDYTHYYITLPSANLARGVQMLGEMMSGSVMDAGELEKERLVILEEYRRKQDSPEAMLWEDVYEQVFEAGPYHRPVIGVEETIRAIDRERMVDFYRRHYAPANMTLLLTGDVDADRAEALAAEHFGAMDRPYDPLLTEMEPTTIARARNHHRNKPTGGEVYVTLTCGGPGAEEPELIVPLDVAQYVLGQGRGSILYQEIKEKRRLASSIACYYATQNLASLFMIDATCEPAQQAELMKAIRESVARFAEAPIDPAQFERARRLLLSGHLFSFETTGGASGQTGYYHVLTGGPEFLESYTERLERVTAEEVREAYRSIVERFEWLEISVGPEMNGAE